MALGGIERGSGLGETTEIDRADSEPMAALSVDLGMNGRAVGPIKLLTILFWRRGTARALALIRLAQHFHAGGNRLRRRWAEEALRRDYACFVQPGARIGPGLRLPHPTGIVIGAGARVGANCTIYHQVTLGGARMGDWQANNYPDIGDDVTIFAGAKLIGAIRVADRAVVGANAVVNRDVPPGQVAVGVPARCRPHPISSDTGPDRH